MPGVQHIDGNGDAPHLFASKGWSRSPVNGSRQHLSCAQEWPRRGHVLGNVSDCNLISSFYSLALTVIIWYIEILNITWWCQANSVRHCLFCDGGLHKIATARPLQEILNRSSSSDGDESNMQGQEVAASQGPNSWMITGQSVKICCRFGTPVGIRTNTPEGSLKAALPSMPPCQHRRHHPQPARRRTSSRYKMANAQNLAASLPWWSQFWRPKSNVPQ